MADIGAKSNKSSYPFLYSISNYFIILQSFSFELNLHDDVSSQKLFWPDWCVHIYKIGNSVWQATMASHKLQSHLSLSLSLFNTNFLLAIVKMITSQKLYQHSLMCGWCWELFVLYFTYLCIHYIMICRTLSISICAGYLSMGILETIFRAPKLT